MSQAEGSGRRVEQSEVPADRLRVDERSYLLQRMTENSDSEPNVRQVTAHAFLCMHAFSYTCSDRVDREPRPYH